MESTVAALLAMGNGILAAAESFLTIEKRFNFADRAKSPPVSRNAVHDSKIERIYQRRDFV